jgi:hypothetical protein
MAEIGSPESRARTAAANNKKTLEEAARAAKNTALKNEVIRIRKAAGISGKGGTMVGGLYKPMGGGGGMNWSTK